MKKRVFLETKASMTVVVDVPDDTPEYEIEEVAIGLAIEETPSGVCAQCSGWGQPWDLDFGDFEPIDEEPVTEA